MMPSAAQLVRAFGAPAKKSLGQCFLMDPNILQNIVNQSGVEPGSRVLEIGAGPGTLTRALLAHGCLVTAVEVDTRAVEHLARALPHPNLNVMPGDALRMTFDDLAGPLTVVANLPYHIATEVFFRLEALPTVVGMTLMFQREVALRFVAEPGSKTYGPLSILGRIRWEPEIALKLPPGAFTPRPKVHSAAIRFRRRETPLVPAEVEPDLRRAVRAAFQQRRKTVRNSLSGVVTTEQMAAVGVDPGARAEVLTIDQYVTLVSP
jgi:16S rRNA (adenine1518-N6/adenine1519-N6)-dimethyltransferase